MTTRRAAALALAATFAALPVRADEAARQGCKLFTPEAAATPTADCVRCHTNHQAHPVDVDYAAAAARQPFGLRTPAEAVRRGAFVPEGRVACMSCHDAASPWKDHIAIPPGAAPRAAVNPRDARTWSGPRPAAPAAGAAVSPTPLCLLCHAFD